ncbi:MAG: SGNH/GDSL hydrolase family protein [Phycisphaerae bacterium]|nr:SGNH/GDSL hydrolase family protein [Phycisphaerae bacterium]
MRFGYGCAKKLREELTIERLKQKRILRLIAISIVLLDCFSVLTIADEVVKIMPLGDSITYGIGSTNYNGYRKPLYQVLTAADCNFDFVGSLTNGDFLDPQHEGHPGETALWLNQRLVGPTGYWLFAYQPEIILYHIGTNNLRLGDDIATYAQDANETLEIVYDFNPDITVILAKIILTKDDATINARIHSYNLLLEDIAQKWINAGYSLIVVDMENALDYGTDMYDYLHPNNTGYAKMAGIWYNALADCLMKDDPKTAFYKANGWNFDVAKDFAVKVDFHYSNLSQVDGWVGMNVGDDSNYVSISAGSDNNKSYFYYEAVINGNIVFEKEPRTFNDGTLYVSYDSTLKFFYLSHTGFGSQNAYVWQALSPSQGQWELPVDVFIGGGSSGAVLDMGDAYLDNFEVMTAVLLNWPPITDIDGNGFIEFDDLWIMCENWLKTGPDVPGDLYKDEDNIINFLDFAEFGPAW